MTKSPIIVAGRLCKNREGYLCWNVFSWVSCISIGSNIKLGQLLFYNRIIFKVIVCFSPLIFQFGYWIISQQIAAAKDPDTSFFRKLDGFQQSELTELKAGSHVFAVYGNPVLLCQTFILLEVFTVIICY